MDSVILNNPVKRFSTTGEFDLNGQTYLIEGFLTARHDGREDVISHSAHPDIPPEITNRQVYFSVINQTNATCPQITIRAEAEVANGFAVFLKNRQVRFYTSPRGAQIKESDSPLIIVPSFGKTFVFAGDGVKGRTLRIHDEDVPAIFAVYEGMLPGIDALKMAIDREMFSMETKTGYTLVYPAAEKVAKHLADTTKLGAAAVRQSAWAKG